MVCGVPKSAATRHEWHRAAKGAANVLWSTRLGATPRPAITHEGAFGNDFELCRNGCCLVSGGVNPGFKRLGAFHSLPWGVAGYGVDGPCSGRRAWVTGQ